MPLFVDDQGSRARLLHGRPRFQEASRVLAGPYKWLMVLAPEGPEDVELTLEPNANPAARAYQEALFDRKIPAAALIEGRGRRIRASGREGRGVHDDPDNTRSRSPRGVFRHLREPHSALPAARASELKAQVDAGGA